jgi:hypothetical protein
MQIDDHLQLDEVEAVARRQIGNTTPVGMARALGVMCEKYLWKNKKAVTSAEVQGRPLSLTPAGSKQSAEEHDERMQRWQEEDDQLEDGRVELSVLVPRLLQLTDKERECLSRGVRELHNRRWLVLQARRGHEAVEAMRANGIATEVLKRAEQTIRKALWLERRRNGVEDGPINLLWYNWKGPVPQELLEGYELPLRRTPPTVFPDNYDTADVPKVWEEFTRMTDRGYMEGPFDDESAVHMTHPMAAVAKKGTTKLRLVIDMSVTLLNDCLVAQRYVLPQVADVAAKCYKGCYMITADLVDGFYAVEVRGEDRKYLGIKHPRTGKYYRYTRLVMGAASSPVAFSRLVAWAARDLYEYPEFRPERMVVNDTDPSMPRVYGVDKEGVPVATVQFFVDDSCIVAATKQGCEAAYKRLVWLLECRLGWRICTRKTVGPTQRLVFCGLELDSVGADVGGPCTRLSEERREECKQILADFCERHLWKKRAPRREMASVVGKLSFAANAIPSGRCFLARLYDAIHEKEQSIKGDAVDYDRDVTVTPAAILDLKWWRQCLEEADCIRLWRTGSFALHRCWSDASNYGFGECLAVEEQGSFPQMAFSHGVWPENVASFSSNYHELATIVHSVKRHFESLRNSQVHFHTDNTTSVKAVNTGTVNSPQLMKLARELKLLEAKGNIAVEGVWLSGDMMQLQGSDGASRSCPWLGMYAGKGGSHDSFAPVEWPTFELNGTILAALGGVTTGETVTASDPEQWFPQIELAGKDTFMHVRPAHATVAFELLMDAQLRLGSSTSFTVVVPMVGMRIWSKYLKHFRRREVHDVHVEGLGAVKHWFLRFEAGDALLPRSKRGDQAGEEEQEVEVGEEEGRLE